MGDFLLGSEGTPGQVVETTPEEFAELRRPVSDLLQGIFGTGGPEFRGDFTAGLSDQEKQILSQIGGLGGGTALGGQSSDFLSSVIGGEFLGPDSNPFLGDLIDQLQGREIKNYERVTLPRLRSDFTASGQRIQPESSSPFDTAAAFSSSDLLDRLAGISTQVSAGNFEQERQRQQQAVTQAGQLTQQNLDQAIQSLQASALPRLIEQLGLDKGLEEFRRRIDLIMQALQTGGALSLPNVATLPGTPGTGGNLGGVLQGIGGIVGAFASSRQFKENGRPVGPVLARLGRVPVERWNYKQTMEGIASSDMVHIGPYAEDFTREFGVGDGLTINMIDAFGVALAAVKELTARVEQLEREADG